MTKAELIAELIARIQSYYESNRNKKGEIDDLMSANESFCIKIQELTNYYIIKEEEHNNLKEEKNKLLEDYNKIKEEHNNLIKDHNEEKELNEFAITQNIELIQENSKLHDCIEKVDKFLDIFNAIKKRKVNDY